MADDFNHWGNIADALHDAAKQVVVKVALDAQGNIQGQIRDKDLIDTGFMLGSVYTVTAEGSSYTGGAKALPQVPEPEDDTTAYVAVGANYAGFLNGGTRYRPATPFFEPGMEATRPGFDAAMAAIEQKLAEASE